MRKEIKIEIQMSGAAKAEWWVVQDWRGAEKKLERALIPAHRDLFSKARPEVTVPGT